MQSTIYMMEARMGYKALKEKCLCMQRLIET